MVEIDIPYFDGARVKLHDGLDIDYDDPEIIAALAAFHALTTADRVADSRHVFAYYRDYHKAVGGEDWLDAEMGIPQSPADIWAHVTPGTVFVDKGMVEDPNCYVVMEAECAWEEEHGLMLVWRNGQKLTKTGGYDGHFTNHDAYADESLKTVVYHATDPAYTTRIGD